MPKPSPDLLIVEDEPDTRFLLTQIFSLRGFAVRSAEDGFAALALIRTRVPDILLSDLNMPGMSGFELLSVVRRLYPEIHVIATSGAYSGTTVPTGIAADGFHAKASGMAPLLELLELGEILGHAAFYSHRSPTPLWIGLESPQSSESHHVLLNCSACLRPFRQSIDEIHAEIRETNCRFCGNKVDYALALATQPPAKATESHQRAIPIDSPAPPTKPGPSASDSQSPANRRYPPTPRNILRA
jgi:CheY-like chemotaxis protein